MQSLSVVDNTFEKDNYYAQSRKYCLCYFLLPKNNKKNSLAKAFCLFKTNRIIDCELLEEDFIPAPYNWKTYGGMNVGFWEKHQNTFLEEVEVMLKKLKAHKKNCVK